MWFDCKFLVHNYVENLYSGLATAVKGMRTIPYSLTGKDTRTVNDASKLFQTQSHIIANERVKKVNAVPQERRETMVLKYNFTRKCLENQQLNQISILTFNNSTIKAIRYNWVQEPLLARVKSRRQGTFTHYNSISSNGQLWLNLQIRIKRI